ncbi:cell wall-binding repeat-containing protein [Stomatohabitans albus]|uniref:cell wall-binding repeat-containing protein n=1 Tax=Stomatohabitans albus TaxID=3110766 RepID=UPI00300C8759
MTFTVKGQAHKTTFNWVIKAKANNSVPTGQVSSIISRVGSPVQVRPITLQDADTPVENLTVTVKSAPEGVSVRKGANGWELVAQTTKVINVTDVVLEVTDGKNKSQFKTTVAVYPAAKITGLGNQKVYVGDPINTITIGITGEQPGDNIEVVIPEGSGLTYNPKTRQISGTPSKVGEFDITVTLKDGAGRVLDTQKGKISVVDRPIKDTTKPTGAVSDVTATVGDQEARRVISLSYGSNKTDDLNVAIQGNAPEGVKVVREGKNWVLVVATNKVIQRTQVTYKVTDQASGRSSTFTNNVEVRAKGNTAPTASVGQLVGQKGKAFTPVVLNVADDTTPIKDLKVVVESQAPVEAKFDGSKWVLVLNTDKKIDPTQVRITVTDKEGLSTSVVTWATVTTSKSTARLVPIADQSGEVKKPIKPIKVQVIDKQPGDQLKVENLPDGITFDPKTSVISGVPTEVKKTTVTVTIFDEGGSVVDRDTFTIDIKAPLAPPANKKPVVYAPDVIFPEGQRREVGITVTDEDPATVKVAIAEPVPGVSVRQDDKGGWVLVADGAKPINAKVVLVATDKEGLKGDPYTVTVKTFRAQVSDLDPLGKQTVDVGTPIKPVTVKINNGQPGDALEIVGVPTWLKFDQQTKTFSGTPDVPGVFNVTVILKSAAGVIQDTEVLTIEAVKVPELSISANDTQTTVNTPLPPVNIEVKNGDTRNVTFDKNLPAGLTYHPELGVIDGTPTEVGVTKLTATVTGAKGQKASTTFTITVNPVANTKAPTGMVNPVVATVGDPTVKREIFVFDADTDDDDLVVTLLGGPDAASLVKEGDRWFLVVKTDKVVPTSKVSFKVSDGKLENTFSTSVTVNEKAKTPLPKPSIDNPGGQTSEVGESIDPLVIGTNDVPQGETPKVDGLPEGLTPKWDPNKGTITITGTPTKPTDKPVDVVITVTDPNDPNKPIKETFPWQVNPKGGEKFGPKGWVDPVIAKVGDPAIKQPIKLSDADTPLKDLTVTMTSAPEGVKLNKEGENYTLDVVTDKVIPTTKVTFQVTDGTHKTLFETTVTVNPVAQPKAPTGVVNPVIATVGDPTVMREIFVHDADTEMNKLVVERVSGPDIASLKHEGNRWFLVVEPTKVLPTEEVSFTVSDGQFKTTFSTTVTVNQKPQTPKPTPSVDNPGGQTSTQDKPIDPLVIGTNDVPQGETPKVDGLPEGLTPNWDPNKGTITITGTPTKPTDKPVDVVITITNPNDPNKPIKETFPWQVNPRTGDKFAPKGWVNPVIAKVGDPAIKRPINLADADTPLKGLTVTMTSAPEGVKLSKEGDSYTMDVVTDKVIPTTKVTFQVTDGTHTSLFETTVTVNTNTDPSAQDATIDVPDGRTVVNTKLPDIRVTVARANIADVTFDKALPAGLTFDKTNGVISGTPTVVGVTKLTASVPGANGKVVTDDFTITVTSASAPGQNPAPSPSNPGISSTTITGTRLQGPTRIETAIAISRRQFKDQSVQSVVIARNDQYADANAATPFADSKSAPVLLSTSNELHKDTAAEIKRILRPGGTIYMMGREVALSEKVESELKAQFAGFQVVRIGGENRFATAAMIYEQLGKPKMVSIVDGGNPAVGDALVAGTAMAYKDGAVLYTTLGNLANETKPVFANNQITTTYTYDPKVTAGYITVGGNDVVERAISTAKIHWTNFQEIGVAASDPDHIVDALAGGAMAARRKAPMLLTPLDVNDTRLQNFVDDSIKSRGLQHVWLYGGAEAIPQNVADILGGKGVKIQWDTFNWTDNTPADPELKPRKQ